MELQFSLNELSRAVQSFWDRVKDKKVFAFHGNMGAGKTTFISALCHHLGTNDVVGSPTFSIINEYLDQKGDKIYHIDLYRLKDEEEIRAAGVEDCVDSGFVCLIEWPEKAPWLFDENSVHVWLEPVEEEIRALKITETS